MTILYQSARDEVAVLQLTDTQGQIDPVFDQNPNLQLIRTPHGGHVAFLAKAAPRFWAEVEALRFLQAALEHFQE